MNLRKQLFVIVLIITVLDIAAIYLHAASASPVSSELHPFTVSEVFSSSLLGDYVYVKGKVTEILEDHVSEKGFIYQQFMVSDREETIKLFCSTKYGRTEVHEGEEIIFDGEFKKYYGTYEIYGFCSEVRTVKG